MASAINSQPSSQQSYPQLMRTASDVASFDSRPPSYTAVHSQHASNSQHMSFSHIPNSAHPPHMPNGAGAYRGYGEVNGHASHMPPSSPPQIYTAVYSGVAVYEMEVHGVAVMRRRSDSWLNATQILKVAGVDKGKRTKILEKEILTGEHEKIQGGYGKYQGTWINYTRGREFCRQYGVEEILRPLLEHDIGADGTGIAGQGVDTPTKEQAMAANRKRFYNASNEQRGHSQQSSGTFFSNISPMASNALAAMRRFDSAQTTRPGSAQRRPGNIVRRPSQQLNGSQETSYISGSQQSMHSFTSETSIGMSQMDGTQNGFASHHVIDNREPPRKRTRPSSAYDDVAGINGGMDLSMREPSPTEPNDSFIYNQLDSTGEGTTSSLAPLPTPTDKAGEEKRGALLDLFADLLRTDYSNHTAILHLSGRDLDIPLDQSANTALHWAATLARVPLMRLLIEKGANIFVGNVAGQTPLMAAVQVKNCYDRTCFPEMLELLGPLIEIRDTAGRTILHHIALTCGVSNRGPASKYYLEALLEFTVRRGGSNPSSQSNSFDASGAANDTSKSRSIGIARFMSEIVNARDKTGNTALNLVARIGNRTIIRQLQEVGADATIPNNRGFRAIDFGVDADGQTVDGAAESTLTSSQVKAQISQVEQMKDDILAATTSILTQTQSQYANELRTKQDLLDQQNAELRDLSAKEKEELKRLQSLQRRDNERTEREQKIVNLRRATDEQRARLLANGIDVAVATDPTASPQADSAYRLDTSLTPLLTTTSSSPSISPTAEHLAALPPTPVLRARLAAYQANNAALEARIGGLKARSSELENQYRRVVSLCAGVDEASVDSLLESLLAAVESEEGALGYGIQAGVAEVGRVREFLRKVEGAGVEV